MVVLLLQFLKEPNAQLAIRIASFSIDTVDRCVQADLQLDPSDPGLEDKILAHILIRKEFEQQLSDLDTLATVESTDELCKFKRRSVSVPLSNVGLPNKGAK